MRYLIEHKVTLTFPQPVRQHHCELRVVPPDTPVQRTGLLRFAIEPAAPMGTYADYFGNRVHHFSLIAPHDTVEVVLQAEVHTLLTNPFDYPLVPAAQEREWMTRAIAQQPQLHDYVLHHSTLVPELVHRNDLGSDWPRYEPTVALRDAVMAAGEWATTVLRFDPTGERHPSLAVAVAAGSGCCHDIAHLVIAVVRSWGFPARFVSGYSDPELADESKTASAGDTRRAWVEVLIPGAGWRGFDPVHQLIANDTYVLVAVGRDASETTLCRSSFIGDDEVEIPAETVRLKRAQEQ